MRRTPRYALVVGSFRFIYMKGPIMKLTGPLFEQGFSAAEAEATLLRGQKPPRLWVITADEGIAKFFRRESGRLILIGEAVPEESLQGDLSNANVGRVVSSGGGGTVMHKYEPHMEAGRQDAVLFAKDLAVFLEEAVKAEAFEKLVLFAAPRMLGYLRAALSDPVGRRIAYEADKDYTKLGSKALSSKVNAVI
jgi:protein required for attachment to host cells